MESEKLQEKLVEVLGDPVLDADDKAVFAFIVARHGRRESFMAEDLEPMGGASAYSLGKLVATGHVLRQGDGFVIAGGGTALDKDGNMM